MSLKKVLLKVFPKSVIFPNHIGMQSDYSSLRIQFDEGYRLLTGHWDWQAVLQLDPVHVITLLRRPVERLVSQYLYLCRRDDRNTHRWHTMITTRQMSLTQFYSNPEVAITFSNVMTRQLAGCLWSGDVITDKNLLVKALAAIQRCAFVGITEQYSESVQLLLTLLSVECKHIKIPKVNCSSSKDICRVDSAYNDIPEHLYNLDEQLYKVALLRFTRDLNSRINTCKQRETSSSHER